jgi:hypothetical protein
MARVNGAYIRFKATEPRNPVVPGVIVTACNGETQSPHETVTPVQVLRNTRSRETIAHGQNDPGDFPSQFN